MRRDPLEPARCPNCGAVANRKFCPECGQARERNLHLPILPLAAEAIQESVGLESRLAVTLPRRLLRP
ncbi:MAG: hypothetical protein ACJ79V_07615, partial [Myxococcales bacterium]